MAKVLKSSIGYKWPETENLIEFLRNGLRRNSKETIIIDQASDRRWTGTELEKQVALIARHLIDECKVQKGDVCTIYGEPNDYTVILMLAIISAGGINNFFIDKFKPQEVHDSSMILNAKLLISTHDLLANLRGHMGDLEHLQVLSRDKVCEGYKNGCKSIGHLLERDVGASCCGLDEIVDLVSVEPDKDFAVIQFSSGTTGKPKPIPRTHKNLCHLVASVDHEQMMDLKPGEVIAGALPITHRPGLWALLASINCGSTFILWSNLSDVEDALRMIERYSVTILSCSLVFLASLGNVGVAIKDKFNLSSLKHVITSGAKIVHNDLPETIVKEFKLKTLRQCFGMTESGWCFLIDKDKGAVNYYLSVGHACPGMEVAILDRETGKPVGAGVRGEIALKGPQIFPGYLTSESGIFKRDDFTQDGWFRTGDQAYFDQHELVYIEGRYKELLIFENDGRFFPNEIEAVLNAHPAIEGACVVKVNEPNRKLFYDIARAYVTLKQGAKVTEKELLDFVAERSLEITLEGGIRILDKFPRLQNGKVDKQTLQDIE